MAAVIFAFVCATCCFVVIEPYIEMSELPLVCVSGACFCSFILLLLWLIFVGLESLHIILCVFIGSFICSGLVIGITEIVN